MGKIEQTIGENVSARRKALGMSQKQLAKNAGLSESTIVRLEKAQQPPRQSNLAAIARVLGCSPEELYLSPTPEQPPTPGKEIIKAAVREALAEGPLPQKFEHPEVLERLRQENADLKKRVRDLENHLKVFESMFDQVPQETLQAFLAELPEQKRFAWEEALSALRHDAQRAPDVLKQVMQLLEDRQRTESLKSPKRGK